MNTATMASGRGHVGTRFLYLVVLCSDMVCVHSLLGDVISDIFKLPASTIKMTVQAANLAHTASRCVETLVQRYCLDLLLYVPVCASDASLLRCAIVVMHTPQPCWDCNK